MYAYYKGDVDEQKRIIDMLLKLDDLYGDFKEIQKTVRKWIEAYENENQ